MIDIKQFNIQTLKSKVMLPKPWDSIMVFMLSIIITIPIFIVAHQNLVDPNWFFEIDRILLFISIFSLLFFILKSLKTLLILCFLIYIFLLLINRIAGNYGLSDMVQDYNSMMFSMAENPNPQDIIISKLLPFPNKTKILKAIDYENPRVRNFALMATTKHFRKTKKFKKYRTLIQCFAVFIEIQNRWNYVNDPRGEEYIAKASESLQHFSGDCDDHAILMAAGVRAVGGTPRLISTNDHIYPEIFIGTKKEFETINFIIKKYLFPKQTHEKNLNYHIDERGNIWLNLDYTAKYPGGPFMSEEILGALTIQ